jgi:putative transposase
MEFLPLEIEVRRHGGIRSEKIEGGGGGERPIEEIIGRSGVGQSHAQGCAVKKVVKPAGRKRLVGYLQDHCSISHRACRVIPISRKGLRYRSKGELRDAALIDRLKALGEQYPRYGYLVLHGMLRNEGLVENRKRTYRLYTALGMQVRTRRRKKLIRPRVPMPVPNAPNERWSMDFVHDQLADGRRFRVPCIVDDYSRVCVGQLIDLSISGARMVRFLRQLAQTRGLPKTLVIDNGPEMTSKAMFFWSRETGVKLHFIQPGKPTQNAFVESFNARFRDSCLNLQWFKDLSDAKRIIHDWQGHYNHVRPHSSLNYRPPALLEQHAA